MEVIYPKKFDMSSCTSELVKISEVLKINDSISQLTENHTVQNLGVINWNGQAVTIYMLSGGVPNSITVNQYLTGICSIPVYGSEFVAKDLDTGLLDIYLYPVEYLKTLVSNNLVFTIGGEKYVAITSCDLTVNNNELLDQVSEKVAANVDTSINHIEDIGYGCYYSGLVVEDARKLSSSDDWYVPTYAEILPWFAVGSNALKEAGVEHWAAGNTGTNTSLLSFWGAGEFRDYGEFDSALTFGMYWLGDAVTGGTKYAMSMQAANNIIGKSNAYDADRGFSVRLFKRTNEPNGSVTEYVGNDKYVYQAIAFNGYYVLTINLRETMWRNGERIDLVTADNLVEWTVGAVAMMVAYNFADLNDNSVGSIVVPSEDDNIIYEVDKNKVIREQKNVSELDGRYLSSLLLRKL